MADDMRKQYKTVMDDHFPPEMKISFGKQELVYRKRTWKLETPDGVVERGLRYGENPGQEAALYELQKGSLTLGDVQFIQPGNSIVSGIDEDGLVQFGKHPGKTNLTDIDNALSILKFFPDTPCCAIMKHNNPCGVARSDSLASAYEKAYFADRIAAFGGCVVLNRPCDLATAQLIAEQYAEVVAAPEYEEGAVERLAKRKNLRIVRAPKIAQVHKYADMRFVEFKSLMDGGMIVQQSPVSRIRNTSDFLPACCEYKGKTYKCEREPGERELEDLLFGWLVEQGVSSNSVLFVRDGVTVSIGTGEQDRVGVTRSAIDKAYIKHTDAMCFKKYGKSIFQIELEIRRGERPAEQLQELTERTREEKAGLKDAVMISDAFFPFRDAVDIAIAEGITAIVHPGGSIRDFDSIEACNEADPKVAMVFTGQRAFKH